MRRIVHRAMSVAAFTLGMFIHLSGHAALNPDEKLSASREELDAIRQEFPSVIARASRIESVLRSPERMLTDGELFFRLKDYSRAILLFSQVQEKYASNRIAYAQAVYRAGEALYAARDLLSARTKFREIADRSHQQEFRPFVSRSVARLVDIAMKMDDPKDPKTADEVLNRIRQLPSQDVDATILYAKGKVLFFKHDYVDSKATLTDVGNQKEFQHQARYILGVIALREMQKDQYNLVVEAFRKVTVLPANTEEQREIIDLAWLAIGRIFYESNQLDAAVDAYQKIERGSKHFDTALYELAWVHVRHEDQNKAARALELLGLSTPESSYSIESDLLRADILLRKAQFKKALENYKKVRHRLDPLKKRIDNYLADEKSASEYYNKLTEAQIDALALPPLVLEWAKEQPDGSFAFNVIDSVRGTKELLEQAQGLLDKLQLVTHGRNRVKSAPELRNLYEKITQTLNRIALARLGVGEALDAVTLKGDFGVNGFYQRRQKRQSLEVYLRNLPRNDDAFNKREEELNARWRSASQQLQQRQVEIDMLQTQTAALRRYLQSHGGRAMSAKTQTQESLRQLDVQDRFLQQQKQEIQQLRKLVEIAKIQVGVGDSRFQNDAKIRDAYRDALEKELALVRGRVAEDVRPHIEQSMQIMKYARSIETQVNAQLNRVDLQMDKRLANLKEELLAEQKAILAYREQFAKFDEEARTKVGDIAKRNLGFVRDKLTGLMLRADSGMVDQAWQDREVRKSILRDRQIELKQQERLLDDEFKQISNDGVTDTN